MHNALDAFERANRLWYRDGRTALARSVYEQARRAQPNDPVVAFQLARVSWSLGEMDEVRSSLAISHEHRDELTPSARDILDRWRTLSLRQAPPADSSGIAIELLDRDRLESLTMPAGEWRKIARAAGARELYAVAIFAFERSKRAPFDVHDEDEERWWSNLIRNRDSDAALLKAMRKNPATP